MQSKGLTSPLHRSLQVAKDRQATGFGNRRQTWSHFVDRVARLAGALRASGIGTGDRVAYLGLNSDRYLEFFFATAWAGAVSVPVNWRWSLSEIVYSLNDSTPKALWIDDNFLDHLPALKELPVLESIAYAGSGASPPGIASIDELVASHEPIEDARRSGNDLAAIFYTGGTTGAPKGVMVSHGALWINGLVNVGERRMSVDDVFLLTGPLFHMGGFLSVVTAVIVGAPMIALPKFEAGNVLEFIERERISAMFAVPTMVQDLLEHPDFSARDLSSLRMISYGASAISETLLRRVISEIPTAQFSQTYGQTELGPSATVLPPEDHSLDPSRSHLLRSAGRTCLHVELEIVGAGGVPVPAGETGEIRVRSPGNMLGYWNQPEITAKTLIDGWVMTGDIGYLDETGYLYIVDRAKDMIVTGGENVFSAEVENVLSKHPAVASVAVIGIPDDRWGEAVHAVVQLRKNAEVTEAQLISHCRELIAGYKCPKSVDLRREPLPLTAVGKISKVQLREPFWGSKDRSVS